MWEFQEHKGRKSGSRKEGLDTHILNHRIETSSFHEEIATYLQVPAWSHSDTWLLPAWHPRARTFLGSKWTQPPSLLPRAFLHIPSLLTEKLSRAPRATPVPQKPAGDSSGWAVSCQSIHGSRKPFLSSTDNISLNVDGKEKLFGMEHMRKFVSSTLKWGAAILAVLKPWEWLRSAELLVLS